MIIRGRNVFKKLTEHLPTYHLSFDRYYSLATANYVRRGGGVTNGRGSGLLLLYMDISGQVTGIHSQVKLTICVLLLLEWRIESLTD